MTAIERSLLPEEILLDSVATFDAASRRAGVAFWLRRLLIGLDAGAALGGWTLGLAFTHGLSVQATGNVAVTAVLVLLTAATVALIASQRLYLSRVCSIRAVEIGRLGRATALSAGLALLLPRVLPVEVSVAGGLAGASASFVLLIMARGIYRHWLQMGRRDGRFLRSVVVIGSNEEGYDLCKLVSDHPELGFRVAGVVGDHADVLHYDYLVPYLGPIDRAVAIVEEASAGGVLIAASSVAPHQLNQLVRQFLRREVHVHLSSGVRGVDHRRLRAQPIAHEPLFYLEPLRLAPWQFALKRAIDFAITVVGGIVLALPVLLLAAIAIKIQDRGPIFYRQQRVGRHGRIFTVLKLRTMAPNADRLYDELARTRAGRDGPLIKLADDPRRTHVGRFLERLSIDELPQLWNVLRGEMSLVGPRPAQPSEVEAFDEELKGRHAVLPGITGLWQVEARDNPSFSAYRRFDLFYIENWSVGLDLAILVATAQRVLLRGIELVFGNKSEMSAAVVTAPVGLD
jgi:exopolysaccharide biosynthesis polyprenyl glycosylphosphotransferase